MHSNHSTNAIPKEWNAGELLDRREANVSIDHSRPALRNGIESEDGMSTTPGTIGALRDP